MDKVFKGEIPFVRIIVPLIIGIIVAHSLPTAFGMQPFLFLTEVLCFILGGMIVGYKILKIYRKKWLGGTILFCAFFSLAIYLTLQTSLHFKDDFFASQKNEALLVQVASEPKLSAGIMRFESDVKQVYNQKRFATASGKLSVAISIDSSLSTAYAYGDLLLIPANYSETEPPRNPGEFDYKNYLANHSIYHQAFFREDQVQLIRKGQGNLVTAFALKLRQKLVQKFNIYIDDKDASSFASTLILGYKADLSREVLSAYSKTGTMHVLSVSGMHVAIVFIVLGFLLKFLDRTKKLRLLRAMLIIPLIWFYALVTGFSPSVCRAALMLTFVVIGKAIHKNQNTYNQVAASAFFLLIYNPYFLFDVGFQLSYIAVLGLIYFYPKIYHLLYFRYIVADWIWSYTALSLAAQLATFPLSIYYFHQFPLYFLISNLFIVLPVTLIMYLGLIFMFIPWPSLLKPMGWMLKNMINLTNEGLFNIEQMPFSNLSGIWITALENILLYGIILSLTFYLVARKSPYLKFGLMLIFMFTISYSMNKILRLRQNQVIFYSVNKNSAVSFISGDEAVLSTDLDQQNKTFTFSVQPSLDKAGSKSVYFLDTGQTYHSQFIYNDRYFTQFKNWKMLRWDDSFNYKAFHRKIKVDLVIIQKSPRLSLLDLTTYVDFNQLVIDATNKDYLIKKWKAEAEVLGLNYYVLKKNPALVLDLP